MNLLETQLLWTSARDQMYIHIRNMERELATLQETKHSMIEAQIYMEEIKRCKYWVNKNKEIPTEPIQIIYHQIL